MTELRKDKELDTRIGKASAVMQSLHFSVVMKRELSKKERLSIFKTVFVPILTYGHESWAGAPRAKRGPGNKKKGLPSKLPLFFPDFDVISKKKQKKVFIAKSPNVLQISIYSPEKKESFAIARPDLSVFYCDGPRGVFRRGHCAMAPLLVARIVKLLRKVSKLEAWLPPFASWA